MSANHAPRLSQLFVAVSAALVTKAKGMVDDREDLWEEKVMWLQQWEKQLGKVFLVVECSREREVDMQIDMADGPVVAEADEAYEQWVEEEIAQLKVDEDMQMEEASQGIEGQGVSAAVLVVMERMSHVEVPQPVCKCSQQAVAEGDDDNKPKISIPRRLAKWQDM
ncbi:hypothetical protein M404DRAFT_22768 [Pisolithus tinctorius Marx 270]|uniref:Uncharacterized protein n=1 Tax=Pisolithus tinctorius Marx 270 TaxID=870435 RepID=A0A0C3PK07_PISTI|nr:hypothetical protein M404DRAFT_22768 [Pisolithus tinctorius Marx 270]